MARPDLWSLLCKWEIVSRGRNVWLTVLSLHSSPITHWESMDLFDWGDTGERNDCSASICSAALCCSLCVCAYTVAVPCRSISWSASDTTTSPVDRSVAVLHCDDVQLWGRWPLGSTAGCTANKSSSYPSCPTRSFLPWILLFMTQKLTVNVLLHHWSYVRAGWTRQKLTWCELRSCQKASWHLDSHRWKRLVTLHMHVRGVNGAVKALITPIKDIKISTRNTSNSVFFIFIVFIFIQCMED